MIFLIIGASILGLLLVAGFINVFILVWKLDWRMAIPMYLMFLGIGLMFYGSITYHGN